MARIVTTKSREPAKLTRAERRRIELDAILDEAMLKEARVPRCLGGGNGKRRKGEKFDAIRHRLGYSTVDSG